MEKTIECNEGYKNPKYLFVGKKLFIDKKYYGDVIHSDEKEIHVEYKGDNMYMQNHVKIIQLTTNNQK